MSIHIKTTRNKSLYIIYSAISIVIISLFNICLTSFIKINNISATNSSTFDANITIKPSLTLDISSSKISMELNPSSKTYDEQDLTVSVGTNSNYGYKLYLTTNGTDLVNVADNTKTIPTLPTATTPTSGYSIEDLIPNYWGYRLTSNSTISSGNYFPFSNNLTVSSSDGPVNNNTTTLGFASKIDYTKPSGTYELTLNFKALPIVTQTYMQNMDPTLCTEDPTVVIDNRDEQVYLIRRLPDGKCWMLDNLNLDLTNKEVVDKLKGTDETGSNTNASSAALNYMKKGGGESTNQWANTGLTYTNWGDSYSYSQPLVNRSGKCDPNKNSSYQCLSPYQGANYTSNTVIALGGTPNTDSSGTANINIKIGDGSYKIGTYYNFCAATAGSYCYGNGTSAGSSATGNATMDICPAGWRLPTGGEGGEYQALVNAIKDLYPDSYQDATSENSLQSLLSTPLAGNYHSATVFGQGAYGNLWSSTYNSISHIYIATPVVNEVHLLYANGRNAGNPIRCIAQK